MTGLQNCGLYLGTKYVVHLIWSVSYALPTPRPLASNRSGRAASRGRCLVLGFREVNLSYLSFLSGALRRLIPGGEEAVYNSESRPIESDFAFTSPWGERRWS